MEQALYFVLSLFLIVIVNLYNYFMNKKKLFGLAVIIPVATIAIVNINVNMNSSNTRGLSVISKANIEVLANDESGQGSYEEQRKKDNGRVIVYKNGIVEDCREIEVTCHGNGALHCVEYLEYDDCKPY